jgi:hypothetical protein
MARSSRPKDISKSPLPEQLTLTGFVPSAVIQTPHQRRAIQVIHVLRAELPDVQNSMLATFLLFYFACEAIGKILQSANDGELVSEAFNPNKNIHVSKLGSALKHYHLDYSKTRLDGIFLAKTKGGITKKSARMLRNGIVHSLNGLDIAEAKKRGSVLTNDMDDFVGMVERAANESLRF